MPPSQPKLRFRFFADHDLSSVSGGSTPHRGMPAAGPSITNEHPLAPCFSTSTDEPLAPKPATLVPEAGPGPCVAAHSDSAELAALLDDRNHVMAERLDTLIGHRPTFAVVVDGGYSSRRGLSFLHYQFNRPARWVR